MDTRVNMHMGMCTDVCIDMCTEAAPHVQREARAIAGDGRSDARPLRMARGRGGLGARSQMLSDVGVVGEGNGVAPIMRVSLCGHVYGHARRHVHRHEYGHVHGYVYGYVYRHGYGPVCRHVMMPETHAERLVKNACV